MVSFLDSYALCMVHNLWTPPRFVHVIKGVHRSEVSNFREVPPAAQGVGMFF